MAAPTEIVVDRQTAMTDVAVRVELRGFVPRSPVTLTATLKFYAGPAWRSQATFVSDEMGSVDVSCQPTIFRCPICRPRCAS